MEDIQQNIPQQQSQIKNQDDIINSGQNEQPKSKNQIKRELKNAQLREKKHQKKLQKKLEKQQQQQQNQNQIPQKKESQNNENSQETDKNPKIKPHIQKYLEKMQEGTKVIVDMQFQDILTHQEITGMREQIILNYGLNKKLEQPLNYQVTSVPENCRLKQLINSNEKHQKMKIDFQEKSYIDLYDKDKLIYLSGDSQEEMETLENDKIYIIGGIVDHNRLKNCTFNKAQEQGIKTQRLPLKKYIQLFASQILNVNHVFAILANLQNGKSWKESLEETIPKRKLKHHKQIYEERLEKRLKANENEENNDNDNENNNDDENQQKQQENDKQTNN